MSRIDPDGCTSGIATLGALAALCIATTAGAEPYIGQFELKTLDSAPGEFEFQSQNAWSRSQPARRVVNGPDGLEFDENAVVRERYALELEIGLRRFLKMRLGVEFENERLDEPTAVADADEFEGLSLTELGAEVIVILAPRDEDGAGLGIVAELETPVDRDESSNLVLGPIVEYQSGRWLAAAVPMLVYTFGGEAEEGERIDRKWDFAYAAQLTCTISRTWSLALEGYGTIERLGRTGHPSESALLFGDFDQHRAGPVLYYTRDFDGSRADGANLTIGLGLLEGLSGDTPDHTAKLSIEIDF